MVQIDSSLNYFSNRALTRINKIHFVGIGGSGMSGIAEVLYNLGFKVTGSDLSKSYATNRLLELGVEVVFSHIAENAAYCDAIVISSAIPADNIEIQIAKQRRIPIIHRAEMLAELMRFKYGIAVAGSHGKTTTTSLIATILAEANQDPTFVVGGRLNKFSSNAKLGSSKFFVAEADESDETFLHLNPLIAIITNIDNDHLANYDNNVNNLKKAFLEFAHGLPFYGLAIVCKDDVGVQDAIPNISRPLLTYGFDEQADIRIINYKQKRNKSYFQILLPSSDVPKDVVLNLPGKHSALNATAAIAVGLELNIEFNIIAKALSDFHGIDRRFQIHGQAIINDKKILLIDDYGHHPKEMTAVIKAIRDGWPENRLVMVFQPHRYSRTRQLFTDFTQVLSQVDKVLLLDIYSAGEDPIEGVSATNIIQQLAIEYNKKAELITTDNLLVKLGEVLQEGDILLMQGAGNIGKLTGTIIEKAAISESVDL
jgi:UDP-N-acetylmuramate--alanine ligase